VIHSVWDWNKVHYDYYKSSLPASVGGWKPLTGLGIQTNRSAVRHNNTVGSQVGMDIEAALPYLPASAKRIGSGPQAVGQLCRRRPNVTRLGLADTAAPADSGTTPAQEGDAAQIVPAEVLELQKKLKSETSYYRTQTLSAFLLGLSLGSYAARFRTITTIGFAVSALLVGLSANSQGKPVKLTKD
jgi:hypothetical protein